MTAVPRTVAEVPVILRENTSQLPTLTKLHPEPTTVGTLATTAGSRAFGWEPSWFFPRELGLGSSGPGPTNRLETVAWSNTGALKSDRRVTSLA